MNAETIAKSLDGTPSGSGWTCCCPAHDDHSPSLSIADGDHGVVVNCHAGCPQNAVIASLRERGLWPQHHEASNPPKRKPRRTLGAVAATYDYRDERGDLLFQVVRYDPKDFRQRRPNGRGGWLWNLKGVQRVLYQLPQLLSANRNETVFIVEGEKDCDTLTSLGLVATTNPQGAGKWGKVDDSPLHGRHIAIFPDNDNPGRAHADQVAAAQHRRSAGVRVVGVPDSFKDVTEWVQSGGTKDDVLALVEATPLYVPPAARDDDDATNDASTSHCVGECDPLTGKLILSPSDPLPSARVFLRRTLWHDGMMTIRLYAGTFFVWKGNRYIQIEDGELRSGVYSFLEKTVRAKPLPDGSTSFVPYQPTKIKVGNLIDAIKAETFLCVQSTPPFWLVSDDALLPPIELLACKSGTLHLPTRRWIEPTPNLFTTAALAFDFDPHASRPERWLEFLDELWADDMQSIETLQEWFGYCLTSDTSQQKMLLLVGPKRSGKGTIGRVLGTLVGTGNVVGPTTSSLATQFGLQPLIGKSLAIVSDARFTGRVDSAIALERLLCISGEDALTIPRKYLGDVTMKLPTRFMFLTNELPRIADASGALAGRFLVLTLTNSFFGREDAKLTTTLLEELPGILLWAIEGWQRLRDRGYFIQPESGRDAVDQLADLTSPVSAFVRDCCVVGPVHQCELRNLYGAWCNWCQAHGRNKPGPDTSFSRDLAAALPQLKRQRPRQGNHRPVTFIGIGLVHARTCTNPLGAECDLDEREPNHNTTESSEEKSIHNTAVHAPACTTGIIGPRTQVSQDDGLFPKLPPSQTEAFEV